MRQKITGHTTSFLIETDGFIDPLRHVIIFAVILFQSISPLNKFIQIIRIVLILSLELE